MEHSKTKEHRKSIGVGEAEEGDDGDGLTGACRHVGVLQGNGPPGDVRRVGHSRCAHGYLQDLCNTGCLKGRGRWLEIDMELHQRRLVRERSEEGGARMSSTTVRRG